MICPYCSADIEPIELNGKTFCSNCGLTIRTAASAQSAQPTIRPISTGIDSTINETENSPTVTLDAPSQPANPVVKDIDTLNNVQENVPEKVEGPVKTIEGTDILFGQTPGDGETLATKEPENATPSNVITESEAVEQAVNTQVETDKKEVFSIEDSAEIRTLTDEPIAQPDKSLADAVKNVETLGASGILLDILNDNAVEKGKEQEREALSAAEALIDNIEIAKAEANKDKKKTAEKDTTTAKMQPVKLKNSMKLKVNILSDSPVNPITHPEVEAAPEELEIEAPDAESDNEIENIINTDDSAKEPVTNSPEVQESEDTPEETETLEVPPEEAISDEEVDKINKNIEEIIQQNNSSDDFSDLPSMKNKKVETPEVIKEAEKELEDEPEKPFVPKEIKNQNKESIKTSPLKDYFKNFTKDDGKKKKKSKTLKAKKERRKKLIFFSLGIIALIGAIALAVFAYFEFLKPAETVTTIETAKTEDAKVPKEIVAGYSLSGEVNFNEETKTHTAVYAFAGNPDRTITFSQTETDKGKELVSQEIENSKEGYVATTVGQTEYFQLNTGSVFWTKDGLLFKLIVKGDTYKELVYKMALSVE